ERMRRDLPTSADDPRVTLLHARALYRNGDYAGGLAQADAARLQAERARAPMLVARAASDQGWCSVNLGKTAQAQQAYGFARDNFRAAGDPIHAGEAELALLETQLDDETAFAAAAPQFARLLAQMRSVGHKDGEMRVLSDQAQIYEVLG